MTKPSRPIFEEVDEDAGTSRPKVATGGISAADRNARELTRGWLMVLFALVAAMILVGGLTRLTDSGLSITEWRPVTGAIPPLNAADWQAAFEKYRAIPEYLLQNEGMSLEEFKFIYWWEWGHRQLGRVIGVVWAAGFLGLLAMRKIPPGWTGKLLFLGLLGGVQGAIGWWMVSSGLDGAMLDVASYRLAVHLGLAFVILGFIGWYAMMLGRSPVELIQARRWREVRLLGLSTGVMHFAFLQILLGALVAGTDAGRTFTDWPLMGGGFFPPDAYGLIPGIRNFFENPGLVQFNHRMVGYALLVFGLIAWRRSRSSGHAAIRRAFDWMIAMMAGQIVLGVVAVLHVVPWQLAILHQFGAMVLWVLILRVRFLAHYPTMQSVQGAP
ncbi:MAG: heme A synthase [Pseudomonadota bacterium]